MFILIDCEISSTHELRKTIERRVSGWDISVDEA